MVIPGFRGLGFKPFLRRLGRAFVDQMVDRKAAELSFYLLFSLFPLLFFLVALAAYLPVEGVLNLAMERASALMPREALEIIQAQVSALVAQPRPKLLTFGLVVALWSASRGIDSFRTALNMAYGVTESRSFARSQLVAIGTTVVSAVLVLLAFAMVLLGGDAGLWLANFVGYGREFQAVWSWLRWPITAMVVMFVAALNYYWLPDVEQRFRYITPGSVTSTLLWLLTAWLFTLYAENFGSFNVTYGSLGGVIVLMTWFYLSSLVFLIGGEINAVIEHASADGKAPGAREPGAPVREEGYPVPPGAARSSDVAGRTTRLRHQGRLTPSRPDDEPPFDPRH